MRPVVPGCIAIILGHEIEENNGLTVTVGDIFPSHTSFLIDTEMNCGMNIVNLKVIYLKFAPPFHQGQLIVELFTP